MTRHLGAAALAVVVVSLLSPVEVSREQGVRETQRPPVDENPAAHPSPISIASGDGAHASHPVAPVAAGVVAGPGSGTVAATAGTQVAEPQIGGRWPGTRITFSDKLPRSYNWAIRNAVKAWNQGSGANITFVRAPRGQRGQVVIKRAATQGSAGRATLGYVPGAWVHLNKNSYGRKLERGRWIMTSVLLAHELGHVLGLGHAKKPAHLMYPYVPYHHTVAPNRMTCRWVTRGDARRAVQLYGGQVALRPRRCAIS